VLSETSRVEGELRLRSGDGLHESSGLVAHFCTVQPPTWQFIPRPASLLDITGRAPYSVVGSSSFTLPPPRARQAGPQSKILKNTHHKVRAAVAIGWLRGIIPRSSLMHAVCGNAIVPRMGIQRGTVCRNASPPFNHPIWSIICGAYTHMHAQVESRERKFAPVTAFLFRWTLTGIVQCLQ
jgi:hypothetical protein